jgi:predicted alpha/beta hydrolase family esterase
MGSLVPLIVPGWRNSGPDHWQSRWQASLAGARRVEQHEWQQPRRADWIAGLQSALDALPAGQRALLIAHSLGCITVAHWALGAEPAQRHRVAGAFLVAPADVERATCVASLRDFAPIPRQRLPFETLVVASDDDPCCRLSRALGFADDWDADTRALRGAGHINVDSGHGDWHDGLTLLRRFSAPLQRAHTRGPVYVAAARP